jgi:TatA/E family protein of Tat protein translocase
MNLGFTEMIFIFFIALLIFGPKKLPELGRTLGKALGEFKRASNELKNQLDDEVRQLDLEETRKQTIAPFAQLQADTQAISRGGLTPTPTVVTEPSKEPHA